MTKQKNASQLVDELIEEGIDKLIAEGASREKLLDGFYAAADNCVAVIIAIRHLRADAVIGDLTTDEQKADADRVELVFEKIAGVCDRGIDLLLNSYERKHKPRPRAHSAVGFKAQP